MCIAVSVAAASASRPPITRKAPYLIYSGVNTEMDVYWQLDSTVGCPIEWGTDTSYSLGHAFITEYGWDHQYKCTITGLAPGTLYYYRVSAAEDVHTGSFHAAPPDDATRLKFLAYGDTRTYPADHDSVANSIIATYTADPGYQTLLLNAGDLVGNGDLETDWDSQFFDPSYTGIRTLLGSVAYQATMGNHERLGILFQKYFPYPFVAGRYWSFDYGPAHFVVVDQYTDYGPGSAQLTWIENDLASTTKAWKILCLHEPGWSSGGAHENEIPVQDYIQPLCEQYEVAMVFGGHNHYYARASVSGIEHVTTGGGGAPLRPPDTGYPFIVTAAMEFHFCRVEIDGSRLSCEVVTPGGAVIDFFELELPLGVDGGEANRLLLKQNRPNPFGGTTTISFVIPGTSEQRVLTSLRIYDPAGRLVRTFDGVDYGPGGHQIRWEGRDQDGRVLPSGVYLCELNAGEHTTRGKVVVLR